MVCCVTIHACRRWKCTFPYIVYSLLEVMAHYWSSNSSKASSTSTSTSVSSSISSRCIVLSHLIILHRFVLWMHVIILRLCNVVILLRIIIWRWYLVKIRCNFPYHHFFLHPIGVWCSFPHQIHCPAMFVIMANWFSKVVVWTLRHCLVILHHWTIIWIIPLCITDLKP